MSIGKCDPTIFSISLYLVNNDSVSTFLEVPIIEIVIAKVK